MKRVVAWRCDTCRAVNTEMPWSCPGCRKETCESCLGAFGHCKICSEGKSEFELVTRANATGEFSFDMDHHARTAVPVRS